MSSSPQGGDLRSRFAQTLRHDAKLKMTNKNKGMLMKYNRMESNSPAVACTADLAMPVGAKCGRLFHSQISTLHFQLVFLLLLPFAAHATNALNLDGNGANGSSGDYVQTALGSNTIGSTFTLEAWVNPTALLDNAIVSTLSASGMELHLKTDGVLCFTVHTNDAVSVIDFTSPSGSVPLNKWTHVAVTFDGATVSMYINGASVAVTGTMKGTNQVGSDAMRIGQRANGDMHYKGSLAEVQVWNTVRSEKEIKADLNGYTTAQTGQLAYYQLDQGTAGGSNSAVTTATDLVGNYHGTLTNFVLSGTSSNWVAQEIFAITPLGTGTRSDPYQIATLPNLFWLSNTSSAWEAYFIQTRNIDASSTASWNSGLGFSPIGNSAVHFTGSYDGSGHTISGLVINRTSEVYVGLFGYADQSVISNVGLVGGSVTAGSGVMSRITVGGLVGCNTGTVRASYATGTVTAGQFSYVGGLVGDNAGTVSASHAAGSVAASGQYVYLGGLVGNNRGTVDFLCYATGSVKGAGSSNNVGGLVGLNADAGVVSTSFATGSISGGVSASVGGFVGSNSGAVRASYATGSVKGDEYASVGGFAGSNWDTGILSTSYAMGVVTVGSGSASGGFVAYNRASVSKCYWDITTSTQTSDEASSGSSGQSSTAMKDWSTYTDWPFVGHTSAGTLDTWDIDASKNNGYPFLTWQYARLSAIDPSVASKMYDGTVAIPQANLSVGTPSGLLKRDQVSLSGVATYASKNVGTGIPVTVTYSLSGTEAYKYVPPLPYTGNIGVITPASLTITAPSLAYTLGTALPTTFDFTYSGFVNGDDASALEGLTASYSCGQCKTAGKFSIVPYAKAANYELTFVNGLLTLEVPTRILDRQLPALNLGNVHHFDLLGRKSGLGQ